MGSEITLLTVYDKVAEASAKIDAHIARVEERLDHGSRSLGDHEARLRLVERAVPDRLGERLEVIEDAMQRRRGMSAAVQGVLVFAGSSTTSAVVAWLLTRGH